MFLFDPSKSFFSPMNARDEIMFIDKKGNLTTFGQFLEDHEKLHLKIGELVAELAQKNFKGGSVSASGATAAEAERLALEKLQSEIIVPYIKLILTVNKIANDKYDAETTGGTPVLGRKSRAQSDWENPELTKSFVELIAKENGLVK
jgi:hypothetical protein